MTNVRTMSVREFVRGGYQGRTSPPVVVMNGGEIEGSWYPGLSGIAVSFTGAQSLALPPSVSVATVSIPAAPHGVAADGETKNGALPAEAPAQAPRRPQSSPVQAVPKARKQQSRGDAPKRPAKAGRRALPDLTRRA